MRDIGNNNEMKMLNLKTTPKKSFGSLGRTNFVHVIINLLLLLFWYISTSRLPSSWTWTCLLYKMNTKNTASPSSLIILFHLLRSFSLNYSHAVNVAEGCDYRLLLLLWHIYQIVLPATYQATPLNPELQASLEHSPLASSDWLPIRVVILASFNLRKFESLALPPSWWLRTV